MSTHLIPKNLFQCTIGLLLILWLYPVQARNPESCRGAVDQVEKLVCKDPMLLSLHKEVVELTEKKVRGVTAKKIASNPDWSANDRGDEALIEDHFEKWLKGRSDCISEGSESKRVGCLRRLYQSEIERLELPEGAILQPKALDDVYLQACSPDPTHYFLTPFERPGAIKEVPNRVLAETKSPYGRPVITIAKSKIKAGTQEVNATLRNFRDLVIESEDGRELMRHKVSGASSLYEIFHQGSVVAWAVGWHKYCGAFYSDVDFTALRIFTPVKAGRSISIVESPIGAYDFKSYSRINQTSLAPILEYRSSMGLGGATTNHYALGLYRVLTGYGRAIQKYEDFHALKGTETISAYEKYLWLTEDLQDYTSAIDLVINHATGFAASLDGWPLEMLSLAVEYGEKSSVDDSSYTSALNKTKIDIERLRADFPQDKRFLAEVIDRRFNVCGRFKSKREANTYFHGIFGYDLPTPSACVE